MNALFVMLHFVRVFLGMVAGSKFLKLNIIHIFVYFILMDRLFAICVSIIGIDKNIFVVL